MRIVSLIASATEIVCALEAGAQLVGRSHECDHPASIQHLPICTAPRFDVHGSSRDIDQRVKESLQTAVSVYSVHRDILRQLQPDVIITQTQCEVCAVSEKDVARALGDWGGPRPRIVSLSPNKLQDVWGDVQRVADALQCGPRGTKLVEGLQRRMASIQARSATLPSRPTVACLEWLDPLMAAGNWLPEMVAMAGGTNSVGVAGAHSPWLTSEKLIECDPEVLIALPCGFDLARTRSEMMKLFPIAPFCNLRAVRAGKVYVTDGNQYFNRPGPRLVESLEILAEIIHPEAFHFGHEGKGWERFPTA